MSVATDGDLANAVRHLREGRLVAFPTETVYGLGADGCSDEAVARVFDVKGRPRFNPLIFHLADFSRARLLGYCGPEAEALAEAFWPGPVTLVLPRRPDAPVSLLACAGLETIAVRCPAHPVARALLAAFGGPVVAPSANRSGRISPTAAAHVRAEFGDDVACVVEGGLSEIGIESTIVDLSDPGRPMLLRPGAITRGQLAQVLGRALSDASVGASPRAPGMMESHYAPRLSVRLNATSVAPSEALLAFGPNAPTGARATEHLSERGDLREAAARLFAALRALDASDAAAIAVMPIPDEGLGEAINDRLRRAAAPRVL